LRYYVVFLTATSADIKLRVISIKAANMALSAAERTKIFRKGKRAALLEAGAFTCPYIDDDLRFAAWIEGYELGELKLAARSAGEDAGSEPHHFWTEVNPLSR
jgi:hypothetical protein